MGILSFTNKVIGVDIGTTNTRIIYNDKIVIDEPSIVAIEVKTGKVIAIGKEAMQMQRKNHEKIKTIRPIKEGVIVVFQAAVKMLKEMIRKAIAYRSWHMPSFEMVICLSCCLNDVEEKAFKDMAKQAGAKGLKIIYKSMAAAVGLEIDLLEPNGNIIIDIGGGTSEISVTALGGIVCSRLVRTGGDVFNINIAEYMLKQHNVHINENSAERIKREIGAAINDVENPPPNITVYGRDILTGIPKEILVNYKEVAKAIDNSISRIENVIMEVIENLTPELYNDINKNGIYLIGGSYFLNGIDKRIQLKTRLRVNRVKEPFNTIINGLGLVLKDKDKYGFLVN